MTEVAGDMIRIGRVAEVRCMTLVAIRVMQLVVATHMARLALHSNMGPGQREQRCAVIEC
jgi:hypothetical protein